MTKDELEKRVEVLEAELLNEREAHKQTLSAYDKIANTLETPHENFAADSEARAFEYIECNKEYLSAKGITTIHVAADGSVFVGTPEGTNCAVNYGAEKKLKIYNFNV